MDQENIDYLNSISKRMLAYDEVRGDVLSYILENRITDNELVTDLFIIGFLYKAHRRGEIITEEELAILLGDTDDQDGVYTKKEIYLADDKTELSFGELLDYTVENYQC